MKFNKIFLVAAFALGFSLTACQEDEPELFDASNNGLYFDYETPEQMVVNLNFATQIIKPIDTLSFDVKIKLLGHLSGAERRVRIEGSSMSGYPEPVFDMLPKEVTIAPYDSVKTVTFKVARPELEDVVYAQTLRIVPLSEDLGGGIEGKEEFKVYVSTIYQKPEIWDESPISTYYGGWTKQKHVYLAKQYDKDDYYMLEENKFCYGYPYILADLRDHDTIDVEVPYYYDDDPEYEQVPDFWTELHNEYIADFNANPWSAGRTFVQIAESVGLTTKTDSLWFTAEEGLQEERMKEINKYGVEYMQDVYDKFFSTMRDGGSYFSTANYAGIYEVPIKKGIPYKFRQPNCWSDDGAYAKACKPLVEKYYGAYSDAKFYFMINTLLDLDPSRAKLYLIFPVSCTYIQEEDRFAPRYDHDHGSLGTGEEIMLEYNEIFRNADTENVFHFRIVAEDYIMKKSICLVMTALLFAGCYEDKGNYDYRFDSMNNIDLDAITFNPQSYESLDGTMIEVQQPMHNDTVVRIKVFLKQTLSDNYDNLAFEWIREYQGKDKYNLPVDSCDTLHSVGYIELPFHAKEHREYKLLLVITDNTTTLKYYKDLTVKTRPIYKNSLFVLHGEDGNCRLGNIELIGDIPKVVTDAYANVTLSESTNPFSKASQLDFSTGYQNRTLCVFNSDGTATVWEPYGRTKKVVGLLADSYVFNKKWGSLVPRTIVGIGDVGAMAHSKLILNYDGKYYVSGVYFCYIPYDNKLPTPPSSRHQTDFYMEAAVVMKDFLLFWDSDNERFLYQARNQNIDRQAKEDKARTQANAAVMGELTDAYMDYSALEGSGIPSPKGMKAVYGYISSKEDYQQAHPYFIFANEVNGEEEYYLYEIVPSPELVDPNKSVHKVWGKAKAAEAEPKEPPKFFVVSAKKLPSLNPGKFASNICYGTNYSTNYIFFIDETAKAVYRYNTMNDELYTVYEAPIGYNITQIKFRSYFASDFQKYLGRYLSIALYND